jgi:hypothetical protein
LDLIVVSWSEGGPDYWEKFSETGEWQEYPAEEGSKGVVRVESGREGDRATGEEEDARGL